MGAYYTVTIMLVFILILAYIVLKFLKKTVATYQYGKHLTVVETIPVAQKGQVSIVKLNNKYYMIGVTEHNINLLKELEDDYLIENKPSTPPSIDFKSMLDKFSKKDDLNG